MCHWATKLQPRRSFPGEAVHKFGQLIGFATCQIDAGEWVHSHNLANVDPDLDYEKSTAIPPAPPAIEGRTFQGYRRADGRAGTRNYVGIISTVNCSASVSKYIARRFDESLLGDYPHVDGVVAFTHDTGCGMQFGGLKHEMLNRVLGGMARHPEYRGVSADWTGMRARGDGASAPRATTCTAGRQLGARRRHCRQQRGGPAVCDVHSGPRRHGEDGRRGCSSVGRNAATGETTSSVFRSPPRKSSWVPNAAAATAKAVSRPTRPSASPATT